MAIARTQLLEDVLNLPLGAGMTVGDWAARDAARERALRRWIRTRPALTPPSPIADELWQACVRIDTGALTRELRRIAEARPASANADLLTDAGELDEVAGEWPALESRAAFATADSASAAAIAGWEDISTEGARLAAEAARAIALHALLAEAGRLKITEVYQVREFLNHSAAVAQALRDELSQVAAIEMEYDLDQLATALAELHTRDLISALARVHEAHYTGSEINAADFRTMRLLVGTGVLRASGSAIAPESGRLRSAPQPHGRPTTTAATSRPLPATGTSPASRPATTRESP